MPQLDWTTYFSQAFWLLICFCTLWFLLSVMVTPKLADIIEQRKRKINDYIQKAEALNLQSKKSLEKYNKTLTAAQNEAKQKLEAGKAKLKNELDAKTQKMAATINKKIADSEFTLAKEKAETLMHIDDISQDLAYNILQKVGFTSISRHDIAQIAQEEKSNG